VTGVLGVGELFSTRLSQLWQMFFIAIMFALAVISATAGWRAVALSGSEQSDTGADGADVLSSRLQGRQELFNFGLMAATQTFLGLLSLFVLCALPAFTEYALRRHSPATIMPAVADMIQLRQTALSLYSAETALLFSANHASSASGAYADYDALVASPPPFPVRPELARLASAASTLANSMSYTELLPNIRHHGFKVPAERIGNLALNFGFDTAPFINLALVEADSVAVAVWNASRSLTSPSDSSTVILPPPLAAPELIRRVDYIRAEWTATAQSTIKSGRRLVLYVSVGVVGITAIIHVNFLWPSARQLVSVNGMISNLLHTTAQAEHEVRKVKSADAAEKAQAAENRNKTKPA
jgi:hypothetical protein